ncbi:melanocyte-stimulating hormone receptor-like [Branchiostoma lanceolatum]|uniref:melanocyte-stimulating hormone receptor-like n=1 Tax=Branchiostoma lanceolatum TaxID=7740 RepID=UPI003453A7FE
METNLSSTLARFGPPNATGRCFEWFAENGLSENVTFGDVVNICGGNSGWGPFAFPGREVLTIISSVLCVLLNGLVVFGVAKLQQKKPLCYLIANLAVTDIMTNLAGNVMLELTEAVTYRKFIVFIVTVLHFPVILSLTGLVLLSVDRYASVQHPIFYHATVGGGHVLAAVAGAWVSAALLCFSPVTGWNCSGLETNDELCFLGAVEGSYILRLAVAADRNQQQQDGRVHMNQQQIVSAQKKARSVLLIIAVFLVAWLLFLWWQLTILVSIYNSWDSLNGIGINLQFRFVFLVVLWISPIVNPLVYAFRLPALRRVVWDSLRNGVVRLWRRLVPPQQVHPAAIEMPVIAP